MQRTMQGRRAGRSLRLSALVVLGVLLAAAPLWAAGARQPRAGIAATAGTTTAAGLNLRSVAGEPWAGTVEAGGFLLCAGLGCRPPGQSGGEASHRAFLPAVQR